MTLSKPNVEVIDYDDEMRKCVDDWRSGRRSNTAPRTFRYMEANLVRLPGVLSIFNRYKSEYPGLTFEIDNLIDAVNDMEVNGKSNVYRITDFDTQNRKGEIILCVIAKTAAEIYCFKMYSDRITKIGSIGQNCGTTVPDRDIKKHLTGLFLSTMLGQGKLKDENGYLQLEYK